MRARAPERRATLFLKRVSALERLKGVALRALSQAEVGPAFDLSGGSK